MSQSAESLSLPGNVSKPGIPPPRNAWKADVVLEAGTIRKDFSRRGLIARMVGRRLLDREQRAMIRAQGIRGVPRFVSRPRRDVLVMSFVEGVPLCYLRPGELSEAFFENLTRLFAQLHAKGVAHGDAHWRNILAHGSQPALVDFAVAHTTRAPDRGGRLFEWFRQLDRRQLYKVEHHFFNRGTPPEMFLLYRLVKR
jgi:tRNA A-37 threonylcarbamoyl transferase component Bud32